MQWREFVTTLNPHQRYLLEEFAEDYFARKLNRRDLLRRSLLATGSLTLTATSLFALGCSGSGDNDDDGAAPTAATESTPAATATAGASSIHVDENDPAIRGEKVTFPGTGGDVFGYLARPSGSGTYPGVIIIHENRGLLPHFEDVARRYARQGYVGLAVDLASRLGGSEKAGQSVGQVNPDDAVSDLQSGLNYLKSQTYVKATALGVTGFCFGGGYTFDLAATSPDIKAAVPYYGTAARALQEGLDQTQAAVFAVYGGNDTRITGERANVEAALQKTGRPYQIKVFDGANHAFFNDTGGSYNEAAATEAWADTLDWFRQHLT
jgi:carboxymethylenebutenolidase